MGSENLADDELWKGKTQERYSTDQQIVMNIAGTFFGSKTEVVAKVTEIVEKSCVVTGNDNGFFSL